LKEKDIVVEQTKTCPKNWATEYLLSQTPADKLAANTIARYRATLKSFFAYCQKEIDPLTPVYVKAWLDGGRTREFQADQQPAIEKE
jgi:site-specific recombinase XerD